MMNEQVIDRLEDFAAKYEGVKNMADTLNWLIGEVQVSDAAKSVPNFSRIVTLSSALVELTENRNEELEQILSMTVKVGE